jgi:magnesium chelatase subunit I
MALLFPFSAIVGQDDMKLAFLIAAVDPSVGGVLVFVVCPLKSGPP